jgi:hypothetical protein
MESPRSGCSGSKNAPSCIIAPSDSRRSLWITYTQTCHHLTKGDGRINPATGHRQQYPCYDKDCPRHWKRYARRKQLQLLSLIDASGPFTYWYHVRLSCRRFIEKGERFQDLTRTVAKIKKQCGPCLVIAIFHRGLHGDHFHLLIGTNVPLTHADINRFWRAHFPAKGTCVYRNDYTSIRVHGSPRHLLRYCLFGSKARPRLLPPWLGCPFRSPIKVYC